ncbi:hypothetical protein [uncultured Desulfosarcina sp.]|uniref:hypothetical protein n=1 Tax=uncultured Desulfosarcina sp. TaxID=218289 RepID=UPI0029C6C14F|nr:hypothetical protein [uncultured Desulfosarcina sp.]
MFEPRHISQEDRLNGRQRTVVVMMNLMLLAELTVCMYLGQQDPDNLTVFFLKTFLPMAGATLIIARILIKRLADCAPGQVAR